MISNRSTIAAGRTAIGKTNELGPVRGGSGQSPFEEAEKIAVQGDAVAGL